MKAGIRLDTGGVLVLAAGLSILSVGVLADNPVLALWGQVALGVLLLGYPLALRDAIRVRSGALELECDPPSGPGGGLVAGTDFDFVVRLLNRGSASLSRVQLEVVTSTGLRVDGEAQRRPLPAGGRGEWTLATHCVRAGPAFLHGAQLVVGSTGGLFRFVVYQPLDRAVKVLPRTASPRSATPKVLMHLARRDALSPTAKPVRGIGSDIRELREHVPGDPFKHIAWKATARARRLIVREFETEVSLSVYVLLDIGPSMRWGPPGATSLDVGVDLAFHLARTMSRGRDRFGMATFDQTVYGFTRASAGYRMSQHVMSHLMEVNAVVQEEFTDALSHDDLLTRVAEFMRSHDRVDLSLKALPGLEVPEEMGDYDDEAVMVRVRTFLELKSAELEALRHYFNEPAADARLSALRTYCRLRGIDLPYRTDALPAPKTEGLTAAVQKTLQDRGGPHTLVLISDLLGVRDVDALIPAIKLARAHRHRVIVIAVEPPAAPAYHSQDELEETLRVAFREGRVAQRALLAAALRAQGIMVHMTDQPVTNMAKIATRAA